jgi:hypothetical protein
MKKKILPALLTTLIFFASCKKDNSVVNTRTSIDGTFAFKYLTASTNSTVTGSLGDNSITNSHYTTINNGGTFVFSNGTMTVSGLTYTVDTVASYYIYSGATLIDSSSYPFTITVPATNGSLQYQLIGSDSIYFPQGSVVSGVNANGTYLSGAAGGHYSIAGNLLTITENAVRDSTFTSSGETFHVHDEGTASAILQKQ